MWCLGVVYLLVCVSLLDFPSHDFIVPLIFLIVFPWEEMVLVIAIVFSFSANMFVGFFTSFVSVIMFYAVLIAVAVVR